MSIKESALTAITSITQSDFVRAVTSAGASRRITVANLAKAIVESYTGSSLAGESQSVKSAIDTLNGRNIKSTVVPYTVTVSAGGYVLLSDYETLGISYNRIVGYLYTSGSYPVIMQFASDGIYLFSSSAITNKAISIKYLYV